MRRRARRGIVHKRRYATDWCAFFGSDRATAAADPNGFAYDITPPLALSHPSVTVLRIVGFAGIYDIDAAGGNGIGMTFVGIRLMEIDDTGAIFDESISSPAVMEDGFAWWRAAPAGSFLAGGLAPANVDFASTDATLIDVKSARRIKADENRLILQLQVDNLLGYGAIVTYTTVFYLRVLWRVSAASGP